MPVGTFIPMMSCNYMLQGDMLHSRESDDKHSGCMHGVYGVLHVQLIITQLQLHLQQYSILQEQDYESTMEYSEL